VVSDEKIFKISANENTLWTLAAMLDFKSAPKTHKSGRGVLFSVLNFITV
jgi:hypothetical protein